MAEESWMVVNLDKRQFIKIWAQRDGWEDAAGTQSPLYQWLISPSMLPELTILNPENISARYTCAQGKNTGLLHLPNETLGKIINLLATPGDAICLALTCRFFAVLAHARASEIVSPWARDRILRVCKKTKIAPQITRQEAQMLGLSRLHRVDARRMRKLWVIWWPADVFTDEERMDLLHYRCDTSQPPEPTFYQYFRRRFKEVNTIAWASPYPIGYLPEARSSPSSGAGDPDEADTMRYKEWVTRWAESIKRERTTINDKLALRNLSRKQFLRAQDLDCLLQEMGLQAGSWTHGLEHVALKRMCWKAEQDAAVWAGDRLEIGEMRETDEQQGWVNVYEEVKREYLPPKESAVRHMIVEVLEEGD